MTKNINVINVKKNNYVFNCTNSTLISDVNDLYNNDQIFSFHLMQRKSSWLIWIKPDGMLIAKSYAAIPDLSWELRKYSYPKW